MESNYNDEYMMRKKEKIFVVNYFDKDEMRWYEEEYDMDESQTREKYINIITGEEYSSLAEVNQAKINFISGQGGTGNISKEGVVSAEVPEGEAEFGLGEETEGKKESESELENKALIEAKKIGVNEEELEQEIAEVEQEEEAEQQEEIF